MFKTVIEFLEDKPGYVKRGPKNLQEKLEQIYGKTFDLETISKALRVFRRELRNKNISKNIHKVEKIKKQEISESKPSRNKFLEYLKSIDLKEEDIESVKYWQTSKGEQRYSIVTKQTDEINSQLNLDKFKEYLEKYPTPSELIQELSYTTTTGVSVIADLHIGAFVRNMILTPDYDIGILKTRLDLVAELINSGYNKSNYLFIQGDLFESITGLNHANSWKQLELYGADAMIAAFEILRTFLLKIANLKGVYIVGGNHDRLTSSNKEDTSSDGAKLVAYFLEREFPSLDFEFSDTVIVRTIDKINYISTHGHLGLSSKTIESLLLNYAPKNDYYNVAISAHLHSRKKQSVAGQDIFGDSVKYSGYVVPSLFTGNDWSEKAGFTSTAGYMEFSNMFNIPRVSYIPLI